MRFSSAAFSLLAAATAAYASGDVFQLSGDEFTDFFKTENTNPVLVKFYAPWCGHCKSLAPKYDEAATILKPQGIRLVKVDCTEDANTQLCSHYGVGGYPTLKVFTENNIAPESAQDYPGQRTTEAIVAFMEKKSRDIVETVTPDELDAFKKQEISFVIYLPSNAEENTKLFESVARTFDDKSYRFGAVVDADTIKAEGVKVPSVVVYRSFDEPKTVYEGELNKDDLIAFVKLSATPVFGEINPETYNSYSTAGIPLAYLFAYSDEERQDWASKLYDVAKAHRGKLNVATINAKDYGEHADNLNLEVGKWPAFVIHDLDTNKKYPYSQSEEMTVDAIKTFVENFASGKLKPTIKSEPIPDEATQLESPVTIIVANNFDEIVMDDDKDVLVEYYAPWCGHCKALAPTYDELANAYKSHPEGSKKVVIAKIDATANDIDAKINGFPTITIYPAGNKSKTVNYSGDRSIKDLAKFISENGSHGIYADSKAEAEEPEAEKPEAEKPVAKESEAEKPKAEESAEESAKSSTAESKAAKETDDVHQEL